MGLLRDREGPDNRCITRKADDQVSRCWVIREPDISFRRRRLGCSWMRVINSQESLTVLAHLSLCCEELFGRSFVRYLGVGGDVCEAVDRLGASVAGASD